MTGRFIGKTYKEYQNEFVEHFPYGKQIGKILDQQTCKNVPRPQNTFLGHEYENSGNQVLVFEHFEKYGKSVHGNSVHNGCDVFPNELMRFRVEAKPIWGKIQKHCKKSSRNLDVALTF